MSKALFVTIIVFMLTACGEQSEYADNVYVECLNKNMPRVVYDPTISPVTDFEAVKALCIAYVEERCRVGAARECFGWK